MTLIDTIRARCVEDGDCLRWQGAAVGGRHPSMPHGTKRGALVRRLVWEATHGPIPPGKIIRCTCGTPLCVAVEHLKLTTFAKLGKELGAVGLMSGPIRSANIAAAKRAGSQAKLSQEAVRAIRESGERGTVLAARYRISEATVSKIRKHQVRREFAGNPWQGLGA